MKIQEFRELRLNDAVIDKKGNLTKAYDIDRISRRIKVARLGGGWQHFTEVGLPEERKTA